MKFEHKHYGVSIKVKGKIDPSLIEAIDNSKICMEHGMAYAVQGDYYRKYKRGKNRCNRCGVRLISNRKEGEGKMDEYQPEYALVIGPPHWDSKTVSLRRVAGYLIAYRKYLGDR